MHYRSSHINSNMICAALTGQTFCSPNLIDLIKINLLSAYISTAAYFLSQLRAHLDKEIWKSLGHIIFVNVASVRNGLGSFLIIWNIFCIRLYYNYVLLLSKSYYNNAHSTNNISQNISQLVVLVLLLLFCISQNVYIVHSFFNIPGYSIIIFVTAVF